MSVRIWCCTRVQRALATAGLGLFIATQPAASETASTTQTAPQPSARAVAAPPPRPATGSDVQVKDGGDRVEIHVADLPLSTLLRMLSAQSKKNIVASPSVQGTVTADLFDVSFHQALDAILRMNNCGYIEQGNFIYVYTLQELAEIEALKDEGAYVTRVFQLNYVTVKDIRPLIEPLLSKQGQITGTPDATEGLETDPKVGGGNSHSGPDTLVVFDVASRMEHIEKVIKELDVRPRQVLIEATILRADLTEDNELGIDFNLVTGVDFEMLGSTSQGVQDLVTGEVPSARLNALNTTVRTDFNAAVTPGGFTFGIIKDQVAAFVRALEQISDTSVLANPKVLTLNKQRGQVIVGRRDGYLTTTVTETTAVQTVEFLETGTQLIFRPFICDDGFVRMEIHPEDSTGSLNEANLPFETTTEVTANILIRDGHTILIGGLFREAGGSVRGQVPVVGNIPGIGALFRQTTDNTEREEVIILLTVHIVDDHEAYEELGDKLSADVERTRLGSRRGLQAFGRDRLALAHYHWALQHLKAGRRDKALWDARMSLHISSSYAPAAKLKERLVGRHSCDYRIGSVRNLIARRITGRNWIEEIGPPVPGRENALDATPYSPDEAEQGRQDLEEDDR